MKESILIIDDEAELRNLLTKLLALEGYQVFEAASAGAGWRIAVNEEPAVVITDVRLPDDSGLTLFPKLKRQYPWMEVIVLTAYGTIEDGVRAIKEGAFDYITKGDEDNKILPVVQRAMERVRMRSEINRLQKTIGQQYHFGSIIGNTPAIRQAVDLARKMVETEAPVLLIGETGTGKEIFAQAIHYAGARRQRPFVAVNCSAFARDLLESEMFGYKAGAFTGATKNKKGLFEEAHLGTLFLDEIGEMDAGLQPKLLRALETQSFIKAGDTRLTEVDVRFIAAANYDLETAMKNGKFREDLYYRIAVMKIEIPPLRRRREDIPLLANHFLDYFARKSNKPVYAIAPTCMKLLTEYNYPGNIRELKNVIERAVILCTGEVLEASLLPKEFFTRESAPSVSADSPVLSLEAIEKQHIRQILEICGGNRTKAARLLGISSATLYRKLAKM